MNECASELFGEQQGAAGRSLRHQPSMLRICSAASVVTTTRVVTDGNGVREADLVRRSLCRPWPNPTTLRSPRQEPCVPGGEVIAFVIQYEVQGRSVRERRGLVKDQASVLDSCTKVAHGFSVQASLKPGKRGRFEASSNLALGWRQAPSPISVQLALQCVGLALSGSMVMDHLRRF